VRFVPKHSHNTVAVTIGIPTYNRADSLAGALRSVLSQQGVSILAVVADNASDDDTREVCAEYSISNSNLQYFHHERNVGAVANFKSLLSISQSKYFMWLADDDWIDPDYVAACVDCLEQNSDVVLAYGQANYYKESEFVFCGTKGDLIQDSSLKRLLGYFSTVKDNAMFYGVYRREVLDGVFFDDGFAGDWLFLAQILAKGKVRQVSGKAIHRRLGGASASTRVLAQKSEKNALAKTFPFAALAFRLSSMLMKNPIFKNDLSLMSRILAIPLLSGILIYRGGFDMVGHWIQGVARRYPDTAKWVKNRLVG
jgi:glycosyltransferase domain-containing protein